MIRLTDTSTLTRWLWVHESMTMSLGYMWLFPRNWCPLNRVSALSTPICANYSSSRKKIWLCPCVAASFWTIRFDDVSLEINIQKPPSDINLWIESSLDAIRPRPSDNHTLFTSKLHGFARLTVRFLHIQQTSNPTIFTGAALKPQTVMASRLL